MPKQILLVDDSVTIHRVVDITFAQEDFAITTVKSVDEGLDRARQIKPDIVLADAGMTGKTGYDLCAAIRQDSSLAKTACLILTSNFSPYDEGKGGQAGADGFVVKPFETQVLIDKVKDAITRRAGGEVAAPRPAAAATVPAAIGAVPVTQAPTKAGVESLSKPLSVVAASFKEQITPHVPAARPAPAPAAPVAAAPSPPRPQPKATLMGIPAVNPAALGITPPAARPAPVPVAVTPPAAIPAAPVRPAPVVEAPRPAPAPIHVEAPRAPAQASSLPASVPQMPRPSLVPGVAQPRPAEAAPRAVAPEVTPARADSARREPEGGIGAVVRQVAERAAHQVPAAIAQKGPEYEAIARLSREVIEQVVWEVVPELAEAIIRAELDRLVRERQNA